VRPTTCCFERSCPYKNATCCPAPPAPPGSPGASTPGPFCCPEGALCLPPTANRGPRCGLPVTRVERKLNGYLKSEAMKDFAPKVPMSHVLDSLGDAMN
jgi:hypothetical protein